MAQKVIKEFSELNNSAVESKKVVVKPKATPVIEEKFINGKLYGIYNVISNKTVRMKEKHFTKFYKKNKECKGFLCKTGRGYFIDGYNVDMKAVEIWSAMNKGLVEFKPKNSHNN